MSWVPAANWIPQVCTNRILCSARSLWRTRKSRPLSEIYSFTMIPSVSGSGSVPAIVDMTCLALQSMVICKQPHIGGEGTGIIYYCLSGGSDPLSRSAGAQRLVSSLQFPRTCSDSNPVLTQDVPCRYFYIPGDAV